MRPNQMYHNLLASPSVYSGGSSASNFLLHFDPVFTKDSGVFDRTFTKTGIVSQGTTSSKFGTASLHVYSGLTGSIQSPFTSDLNIGIGSFTLDYWFMVDVPAGGSNRGSVFIGDYPNGSYYGISVAGAILPDPEEWAVVIVNRKLPGVEVSRYTSQIQSQSTNGVWHHIAVVQQVGVSTKVYIDGIYSSPLAGSTNNIEAYATSGSVSIGAPTQDNNDFYMDEVRLTRDARWLSNFTTPTQSYTPSQ